AITEALDFETDEIVFEFAEHDGFPRKALERAIANRDAVTPDFLERIEAYLNGPGLDGADEDALFFIVHLLAQFREKRAYRLLMRLFSLDSARLHRILGEAKTETLSRIAISVFDGDPGPMQEVIEDKDADEFVRSGLFQALAFLVKEGRVDLEDFKKYLLRAYAELRPQGESHVWVGWQSAISLLGLTEFSDLVRKAFASGRIHPGNMRYRHFQKDVQAAVRDPESYKDSAWVPLGYFDDTIGEMESWAAFSDEPSDRLEREPWEPAISEFLTDEPHVNPIRDVGRNDPCPCGSGRKFKKCCLQ
ncbi:MAG: DUF1186 domain-containing protein, partial [Rhodospirillales bacterium]|nr:DUF1186 domain-containing protein [Rhodospirillales bacterium]